MCQFNYIILPTHTNREEATSIFRQHGFNPSTIQNQSLAQQLPGKIFLVSPKETCDCGSVITSARHKTGETNSEEKEMQKLKRKGWTDTRIRNHLASRSRAGANQPNDKDAERERWCGLINSVLTTGNISSFGILAHEFTGDPATESFTIASNKKLNLAGFQPRHLDNLAPDVYLEIGV